MQTHTHAHAYCYATVDTHTRGYETCVKLICAVTHFVSI